MFARNTKNDRDVRQNRHDRTSGPVILPGFMRSNPDGELATMYRRIKAASTKSKLPAGRDRRELEKRRPMSDEYAHVRSPVGAYIRRPFTALNSKRTDYFRDVPPVPAGRYETFQNASYHDYGKKYEGDSFKEEEEELGDRMCSEKYLNLCKGIDVDSVLKEGIAKVQHCKSTEEVFTVFAETYHDVFERVTFEADTVDSSTQTSAPKLQRTQTNLVYAGFWESCSWRQNRSVQTENQNLTFIEQPTVMLQTNSSGLETNWMKKLFGWKTFGTAFMASAVILGLMEIPKLIDQFGIA